MKTSPTLRQPKITEHPIYRELVEKRIQVGTAVWKLLEEGYGGREVAEPVLRVIRITV